MGRPIIFNSLIKVKMIREKYIILVKIMKRKLQTSKSGSGNLHTISKKKFENVYEQYSFGTFHMFQRVIKEMSCY